MSDLVMFPTGISNAPWSYDQMKSLNEYQRSQHFPQKFTCGNNSTHPVLVAIEAGWICRVCDYTQNWAYLFVTEGSWRSNK